MTHILITSGGTQVPIDPVRAITNKSTGRFGAAIAAEALKADMKVTYLAAASARSPFSQEVDFNHEKDWNTAAEQLKKLHSFTNQYRAHYHEYRYHTFTDYAEQLETLVTDHQPDIIVLAAAVSDYLVEQYSENKVRSSEALQLSFKPAPKLIHAVRTWSPKSFIVGFKLLVNANAAELADAAKNSIAANQLDLCVANDLTSLQRGAHEIMLVAKDGSTTPFQENIAHAVINACIKGIS